MSPTSSDTLTVAVDRDILDLAETFLHNRQSQQEAWRQALAQGNLEVSRRLAHEIKGTAGAFGFYQLSDLALELEDALASGDLMAGRGTLEHMIDLINRTVVVPG